MKRLFVLSACCAALVLTAQAQDVPLPVINYVYPPLVTNSVDNSTSCLGAGVTAVPMDCFSFTDSKSSTPRTLAIIGRSPFSRGKSTTTVKVMIVPLVITIGGNVFDPTATNTCFGLHTQTDVALFQNSPILQNVAWDGAGGAGHGRLFNGVNVGTTTYNDANRRAEYWGFVANSGYHTAFSVTTHSAINVNATSLTGGGATFGSGCGLLGALFLNGAGPVATDFDFYIQNTVIPSLGIAADTFPIFLMHNVVLSGANPPNFSNCCVLGYHGTYQPNVATLWTYSPMDFDTSGDFGAGVSDTSVAAHEVGEWLDDPLGSNPTPAWGGIGQVGGCQGNWEVGDPLSGTISTPSAVPMPNGYTYHLQELAFFSWFYNGYTGTNSVPSIGTGGKFSGNGTFVGASKPCPPGGTEPN
jgi:hypothetical protein